MSSFQKDDAKRSDDLLEVFPAQLSCVPHNIISLFADSAAPGKECWGQTVLRSEKPRQSKNGERGETWESEDHKFDTLDLERLFAPLHNLILTVRRIMCHEITRLQCARKSFSRAVTVMQFYEFRPS